MKKLFKKLALMVVALLTFSVGSNYTVKEVRAASYVESSFGEGKLLITTTFNGTTYYLPSATTGSSTAPSAISFTNVSDISEENLWTITASGTNYYIKNSEGNYLYTTNTNNGVRISSTERAWKYDSSANSFQDTSTNRYLGIYNGSNWRCYTTVNQSNYKESSTSFVFYSVDSGSANVSVTGDSYTQIGKTINLEAELSNISGDVTWSSSNENIATVENGVVTAKAVGSAIITADVNGTKGEKEIKVYPIENSELSISEAITICELTGNANAPYTYSVIGSIESIDEEYNSQYDNISVTISDDENAIIAYRMKGGADLYVGVEIKVTGTLINYGGNTPEFTSGATYTINEINYKEIISTFETTASLGFDYSLTYEEQEVDEVVNEYTATLSFADTSTRVSQDVSSQVWKENGIILTNEKGASTSDVIDSYNPVRIYKSSTITISLDNSEGKITKIIFNDGNTDKYRVNSSADTIGVATENEDGTTIVVVNEESQSSSISFTASANQLRLTSITVTYEVGGEAGTEEVVTDSSFDNISILFGAEVETSLFEDFTSVTAGVMFSAGDTLDVSNAVEKEVEILVDNDGVYSVGAVLEVFADGEVVTDGTKERLSKNVTAAVYFVLDGETVILEPKTYSVETMVDHYVTNAASLGIEDQYTIDALKALQAYIAA